MSEGNGPVDPTRLSVEQAAKLLSAAYGERIEAEKIREDLQSGAPADDDGTINLVHYAAWQAKEMGRGECPQETETKRAMPTVSRRLLHRG